MLCVHDILVAGVWILILLMLIHTLYFLYDIIYANYTYVHIATYIATYIHMYVSLTHEHYIPKNSLAIFLIIASA